MEWPWNLVKIFWNDYGRSTRSTTLRTPFEDGAVRQARRTGRALEVRQLRIACKLSNMPAMRDWIDDNVDREFTYRDPEDSADRQVRIVNGAGGVSWRAGPAGSRLDGERFMVGELELEGYW